MDEDVITNNAKGDLVGNAEKPYQSCYGCGARIPSGFTLCDDCFYKKPEETDVRE